MELLHQKSAVASELLKVEEAPPSVIGYANKQLIEECFRKDNELFKAGFIKSGLLVTEEFIKEHCVRVRYEDDRFEHIWYHFGQPDAKRIISFEKDLKISWVEECGDYKMIVERRYY